MHPSVEAFHALARSSPWRWTTLHFRHRSVVAPEDTVEVRIVRPDGVRVVGAGGRRYPPSGLDQRLDGRPTRGWDPPTPTYRPDGLVAVRPPSGSHHDAMLSAGVFWNSYAWQAMLDPVELSHHVAVADLGEVEVAGRPAWQAVLTAEDGYDPLCPDCCDLLPPGRGRHVVALDVETGVVVRIAPADDRSDGFRLQNDVLASD